MFLDSHCHLDLPQFASDLPGVIERAKAVGVNKIITNGGSRESNNKALEISKKFQEVECLLGIDPHDYTCDLEQEGPFTV